MAVSVAVFSAPVHDIQSAVIYVNAVQTNNAPDGTSWSTAFPGVQQAINSAGNGDQVWVAAGTYFENLTVVTNVALYGGFTGIESDLRLRNWTNHLTVLDGRGSNSVVLITAGVTNTTRLDGFVVQNGKAVFGGGIFCSNASPTIVNNIIIQNQGVANGGGISCRNSSPLIVQNVIQYNSAASSGGGIECFVSAATIRNNQIIGNYAGGSFQGGGGLACSGNPAPEIANNLIAGNLATLGTTIVSGGIAIAGDCPARVINNTIVWNQGGPGAGINYNTSSVPAGVTGPVIANNIIAFGSSGVRGIPGMAFNNNCVFGNERNDFYDFSDPTGTNGNISLDPQLIQNPLRPNVHLLPTSPCRDVGDDSALQPDWLDIDGGSRVVGTSVDIGADEFDGTIPAFVTPVVRVSPAGNDAGDGLSWATAKRTLQDAINTATLNGGAEVWAAAGTFNERIRLMHFVHLYGGFSGSEINRAQRNWQMNSTILDPGQDGSVVTATNLLQWNTIDGFTIQNGRAPVGGGVYCSSSSPIIANNIITGNMATNSNSSAQPPGGGIYCSRASPTITNNVISLNRALNGGGIYCSSFSTPLIANNRFEGNVAATRPVSTGFVRGGGGIYVTGNGNPNIANNFFLNNVATNGPGSTSAASGGALACDTSAAPRFVGNTLVGNLASSPFQFYPENGGGIYSASLGAIIANNVVAFGSSGITAVTLATNFYPNVRNNCVFGNGTNYIWSDLTGTNGNISVDPRFQAMNDFHLRADSPCINAGLNSYVLGGSDIDGKTRIAGGTVDVGAHEFQSPTSVISYAWLQQYGLLTDGSADYLDSDNDLIDNWREWIAGTVPINTTSTLRLLSPTNNGSGVTITWQSVGGRTYFLERSADLATHTPFTLVTSNIVGQAGTTGYSDTNAIGTGPYFYRVGVQQ